MGRHLYIVMCMICVFISGCSRIRSVEIKEFKDFKVKIMDEFKGLEECEISFFNGPQYLSVYYVFGEMTTEEELITCYENTKDFLLSNGMEKLLEQKHIDKVMGIFIEFKRDNLCISYSSNLFKPGPNGYQDSRYWTEDNVDNFQTWTMYKSQKEDNE